MSEPFVGEIRMFGFNFEPQGWAFCDGRLLPISQNAALFSLLGTTYGGDGVSTFALPDLRSRVPVSQGQGEGLSSYAEGQAGGTETVTLTPASDARAHPRRQRQQQPGCIRKAGRVLARSPDHSYVPEPDTDTVMNPKMIGEAGNSQPHDNIQPYLVLNFCIALQGVFPARE